MNFSLFELLLLIGLIQGVVTSALLLTTHKNKLSNRVLALAVLAFCLLSTKILFNSFGFSEMPSLRYMPVGVQIAIPPLLYLYIICLTQASTKISWRTYLHFIPFGLFQAFAITIYVHTFGITQISVQDQAVKTFEYDAVKSIEDYLTLFSIFIYLLLGYQILRRYRFFVTNNLSDSRCPTFNWLLRIFVLSAVLGVFLALNMLADFFVSLSNITSVHWDIYFIYISFLIYYLGFAGYTQPDFVPVIVTSNSKANETAKISSRQVAVIIARLENELLQNKIYLNPTINSLDLCKELNVSQTALSFAINQHFQKSFRELINEYRIKEVKSHLRKNTANGQSILSIALECGFNSEASFYRIFKKQEGLAPKAYLSRM